MNNANPYAPPEAALVEANQELDEIEQLDVSETWKERFRAIHKAGGPSLPYFKELPKDERRKAQGFNILAFLFGPFYYLAKGMWRKAIVLLALGFVILLVLDVILILVGLKAISNATGFGFAAVWALLANKDYYRKMVLKENGWWW